MPNNIMKLLTTCLYFLAFPAILAAYTPGEIKITVEDFSTGNPVPESNVTLNPGNYTGITDTSGIITFTGLVPYRNYYVSVTKDGYIEDRHGTGRTGFIGVQTGATTEVTVPLQKASTVSGRITTAQIPIENALVAAVEERIDGLESVATARTDDNGTYILNIPPGNLSIRAVADQYYEEQYPLTAAANSAYIRDFELTRGSTALTFTISPAQDYYGSSVSFTSSNLLHHLFFQRYFMPIDIPEGAELIKAGSSSYIPTLPGDYTFVMFVIDINGVGKEVVQTVPMVNSPPTAHPSVIPGPSELPLLYDNETRALSSGLTTVKAGETVYLRGWGRDENLPSPEDFNPDAPLQDIYGNKNGDWGQSAFSFSWELSDSSGQDLTNLLSNPDTRNPWFQVPEDAANGEVYTASLVVIGDGNPEDDASVSDPADITITVAGELQNEMICLVCHLEKSLNYATTTHAAVNVGCQDCHGPAGEHLQGAAMATTHWPGMCGRCHDEFAQWQKSRHSDPLAFGHAEVAAPLISNCYKCHYTDGFINAAASGNVESFSYPMGTPVPVDTPNVSCDICHDPHRQSTNNPVGIRTGSAGSVCGTCHEKKWQNATLRATAGEVENGYHWDDYSQYQDSGNPHLKTNGCVMCHMATDITDSDSLGIAKVGGHGLRMRDAGTDGDLGTADDLLNIGVCRTCHNGLDTFDHDGFQTAIRSKLTRLGDLLKGANHEFLPPFQPGKCATCHRGGTLRFINETADEILNNAYKNYSLILHDRSFGVHNPAYIERLLDDSIAAVQSLDHLSLSAVSAEPYSGAVVITWSTAYEKDLNGFNLYQSTSEYGSYTKINDALIPAEGSDIAGSDYAEEITGLLNGMNYFFRIESIDSENNAFKHAPVSVIPRLLYLLKAKSS